MSHSLREIAQQLSTAKTVRKTVPVTTREVTEPKPVPKVQLIYAFNGSGKTRLSREFKEEIAPKNRDQDNATDTQPKILYYNAFTEDLFYWDNDLEGDVKRILKIQPNAYTEWVLRDQGQDQNAIAHFQRYTNDKLTPQFNQAYTIKGEDGKDVHVPAFSEITFSYRRGNDELNEHIKISKGEESCFIWSIFYSLIEQVVDVLNVAEPSGRETNKYDLLEYIFIDDPVSSLDENHLIELAVDIASIIKHSESDLKFVITTHNPLFYNVLHNELKGAKKHLLRKHEDGGHSLEDQNGDSPFAYHLYLKGELEKAIQTGQIRKFHFNFLRNLLEKTSTFLGYERWADLLPRTEDGLTNPYEARMINLFSHSKHSAEEVAELNDEDKRVLGFLVGKITETYRFKTVSAQPAPAE
jgi:hypothetical protein